MTDIDGFEEAAAKFRLLEEDLEDAASGIDRALDRGTEAAAQEVLDDAKDRVPVRTGKLKSKLEIRKQSSGNYLIGTDLPRGYYVEFGRGPVVAKNADALKFTINGQTLYRQSVGPAAPQPYLRPALVRNRDTLADKISGAINRLFERVFA